MVHSRRWWYASDWQTEPVRVLELPDSERPGRPSSPVVRVMQEADPKRGGLLVDERHLFATLQQALRWQSKMAEERDTYLRRQVQEIVDARLRITGKLRQMETVSSA